MHEATPLWISESDVVSLMDLQQAIDALEIGLRLEASGEAQNMVKTHTSWSGGNTLHAIGAVFPYRGFAGAKTWAHTTGGASPLLILFDSSSGRLLAVIEAFALGQMRTAAVSGVATRWLASPDADELAMIGTGRQALPQIAVVLAVRPIKRVRVAARDYQKSKLFAASVQEMLGVEAIAFESIREAVENAPVVTVATRATNPMIDDSMITPGAHVNSVGAIVPSRAEVSQRFLEKCSVVAVDSLESARELSRELLEFYSGGVHSWDEAVSLASIVGTGKTREVSEPGFTFFKSLGMGISDLSLGIPIYEQALEQGLGREFPEPRRIPPRLRPLTAT